MEAENKSLEKIDVHLGKPWFSRFPVKFRVCFKYRFPIKDSQERSPPWGSPPRQQKLQKQLAQLREQQLLQAAMGQGTAPLKHPTQIERIDTFNAWPYLKGLNMFYTVYTIIITIILGIQSLVFGGCKPL